MPGPECLVQEHITISAFRGERRFQSRFRSLREGRVSRHEQLRRLQAGARVISQSPAPRIVDRRYERTTQLAPMFPRVEQHACPRDIMVRKGLVAAGIAATARPKAVGQSERAVKRDLAAAPKGVVFAGAEDYNIGVSLIPADPFARGRAAFTLGIPRDAVPYLRGPECDRWKKGWDAGYDHSYPGKRYS